MLFPAEAVPNPVSREKARALVKRFGRNSFAWKILHPEMELWFSRRREGVIGYRRHASTRIVAGAPAAALEDMTAVVEEFEEDARAASEEVCYFGAEGWLTGQLKGSRSHKAVLLGAQPVWNPSRWTEALEGRASVRALVRFARRRGVRVEEVSLDQVLSEKAYEACLEDWLSSRGLPEMGFLVDVRFCRGLSGLRFFGAFHSGGLAAFAVLAPVPARRGWLIEHLIRGRGAVKGVLELMMDDIMGRLAAEGAEYTTLGLAPLSRRAGLSYRLNPGWLRAFCRWLYYGGTRFYSFKGLDAFKAKFNPASWEPVYAVVNKPRFSIRMLYPIAGVFCRMPPVFFFMTALAGRVLEWFEG